MAAHPPDWPEDFLDAHIRHWEDAELLFGETRLANADHLYGLSAECGLKALWPRLIGRNLTRRERIHIDRLWDRFVREANNRRLLQLIGISRQNPFADWRIDQRYANRQNFNQNFVDQHRQGAAAIRNWVREVIP